MFFFGGSGEKVFEGGGDLTGVGELRVLLRAVSRSGRRKEVSPRRSGAMGL